MSSDRCSFIREMRRRRERRLRIARYLAARDTTTGDIKTPTSASESADDRCEPDAVVRHRLRQSGYDPDRWRNDVTVLLTRLMRLYSWLALATLAVTTVLAASGAAYAAAKTGNADFLAQGDVDALKPFIDKLRIWLVVLLASIATLFLVIGALRLTAAGGDPGEAEKGKSALKSAATGYALALLAPVIVTVIGGLFG